MAARGSNEDDYLSGAASRRFRRRLFEMAETLSIAEVTLTSLCMIAVIGSIDIATGTQLSLSVFYLTPVFFMVWFGTRRRGLLIAILSTLTWASIELMTSSAGTPLHLRAWNTSLRFGFFVIVLWLLDDVKHAHGVMERLSRTDSLTGLVNHATFYAKVGEEIDRAKRHGRPFTVAYIDVDGFKAVNDTVGHLAGDDMLRLISKTIERSVRSVDVVARLGGDEFGILLSETDHAAAQTTLSRIRGAVTHRLSEAGKRWPSVSLSIGVAVYVQPPETADEAVGMADSAMYQSRALDSGNTKFVMVASPAAAESVGGIAS